MLTLKHYNLFFILHYHSFSPHYIFFLLFILTHVSLRIVLSHEGDAVSIHRLYAIVIAKTVDQPGTSDSVGRAPDLQAGDLGLNSALGIPLPP